MAKKQVKKPPEKPEIEMAASRAKELTKVVTPLTQWTKKQKLATRDEYNKACVDLESVKNVLKQVESERKSIVKPINDSVSKINAKYKLVTGPLNTIKTHLDGIMGRYVLDESAKEQARVEKLAAKAEARGEDQFAEDLRENAVSMAKAELKDAGQTPVEYYSGKLVDIKLLAAAVINGKAPVDLLEVNQAKLNALARATSGGMEIPGVRWVKEIKFQSQRGVE